MTYCYGNEGIKTLKLESDGKRFIHHQNKQTVDAYFRNENRKQKVKIISAASV